MAAPRRPDRLLLLFAHPSFQRSRVHAGLLRELEGVEGLTFHDLYPAYPDFDFDVDVAREQELLLGHDAVLVQHPLYGYSTPPLVKQWEHLALEHGWAYGAEGDALHGKLWLSAVTTGGSRETYRPSGTNRFTVREFLAPIEQTAVLCGMRFLPPFVVFGTHALSSEAITEHARDYRRLVKALRDDRIDLTAVGRMRHLSDELDSVLPG